MNTAPSDLIHRILLDQTLLLDRSPSRRIMFEVRKERRFVEHTLQLAIEACLDAASHVISDDRLGEPHTNQELFRLLAQAGRISRDVATCVPPRAFATCTRAC